MYGIGNRLDTQPELLFLLRGVDSADLIATIGAAPAAGTLPVAGALVAEELSDVFGVEIDTAGPAVPPAIAPEAEAAPKRPRGRPRKSASAAAPEPEAALKRPRGRPRKDASAVPEVESAPKRPRGRPRKDASAAMEPAAESSPRPSRTKTAKAAPRAPKSGRRSATAKG
jgi:hypothetical protein